VVVAAMVVVVGVAKAMVGEVGLVGAVATVERGAKKHALVLVAASTKATGSILAVSWSILALASSAGGVDHRLAFSIGGRWFNNIGSCRTQPFALLSRLR
jgi:hypothetical protein